MIEPGGYAGRRKGIEGMRTSTIAWVLAAVALSASAVNAQDKMQPVPPAPGGAPAAPPAGQAPAPAPAPAPEKSLAPPLPPFSKPATWSSPQVEQVGKMLEGVWRTTTPVGQGGDKTKTADVVVAVAHVQIDALPDTMYVEAARVDAMWAPFRQAIWQVYLKKGQPHLRTFEFRQPKAAHAFLNTLWAAPDFFPCALDATEMYATLDVALTLTGDSLMGKTLYPYPTGRGGAVEMTSEIACTKDTLVTIDRGYGADGSIVWGSGEGQKYSFKRYSPEIAVKRLDAGLLRIDYPVVGVKGEPAKIGGRLALHYAGSLLDGLVFDNTRLGGRPFIFEVGQELIKGMTEGIKDVRQGERLKLLIPPALAYGEAGRPRSKIPSNATLAYDIEVLTVEAPQEKPAAPAPGASDAPKPGAPGVKIDPVQAPPFTIPAGGLKPGEKKPDEKPH